MTHTDLQEPDARLLYLGKSALSDNEIMSLIVGGSDNKTRAEKLLRKIDYNYVTLSKMSYQELKSLGFSHLQAVRVIAVIEMSKRIQLSQASELDQIRSSSDIFTRLSPVLSDLEHEEFWVLFLNRANRVIATEKISQGGVSGTVTDVRIVLKRAILLQASGMIVAHNHPSGNTTPSDSDIRITQKIKDSAALMDIQLLDHVIIAGRADYYSFADNGAL